MNEHEGRIYLEVGDFFRDFMSPAVYEVVGFQAKQAEHPQADGSVLKVTWNDAVVENCATGERKVMQRDPYGVFMTDMEALIYIAEGKAEG